MKLRWLLIAAGVCAHLFGAFPVTGSAQDETPPAPLIDDDQSPPDDPAQPIVMWIDTTCKKQYLYGEPIILCVQAKNRGLRPIDGFYSLEGGWACAEILEFVITNEKGKSFGYHPGHERFNPYLEGVELVRLDSGVTVSGEFNVKAHSAQLPAGTYTISAIYKDDFRMMKVDGVGFKAAGIPQRIPSWNSVTIRVSDPTGSDFDALLVIGDGRPMWPKGFEYMNEYSIVTGKDDDKVAKLMKEYPNSVYTEYAAFYLGSYWFRQKNYAAARPLLEKVASEGGFILADNAMLLLAQAHRAEGDLPGTRKRLERLLWNFPNGDQAASARRELDSLRQEENQVSPPEKAATVAPEGAAATVPSSSADPTARLVPVESERRRDNSRESVSPNERPPAPTKPPRRDPNPRAIPAASNDLSLFTLITSAISLLAGYLLGRYRHNVRRAG